MWENITKLLSFTGVSDKSVWQGILISSLLIPIVLVSLKKATTWWNEKRPSKMVLNKFLDKRRIVYFFHSQMSGADEQYELNRAQKYITRFPNPLPTDRNNLEIQRKCNIDPVISVAEAECFADVYNVLGLAGKNGDVNFADLIKNWDVWSESIFSIGFNPKTQKLIERCAPIHFELLGGSLKLKDANIVYDSVLPNDAGIIQKTYTRDTQTPIFILAGLGTIGTSSAGYIFKQNYIKIGKLFGSDPFCIFLKVKINEGRTSAIADKIYPHPKLFRKIIFPLTYYGYKKRKVFDYS